MKIYRRRSAKPARIVQKILLVGLVVIGTTFFYYYNQYQYFIGTPVNPQNKQESIITIKKGDSTGQIASLLHQKELILNQDSFKWYTKLNNLDKNLKTGRFPLNQSMTIPEIIETLSSDQKRQEIVTIPEGSTTEDIDQILANLKLIQPGEFNQAVKEFKQYDKYSFLDKKSVQNLIYPLEGYLFPDTYYVNALEFDSSIFISQLLNTFKQKALPVTSTSSRSLEEIINVAAMVEEETNTDQARPIVAGIIWKRLDEQWTLGIDATLLYLKKGDRSLNYNDLKEDSEYNTRTRQGLPKGPIANPGLASIKAAAQPEITDYYFYLTSKDGQMIYAKTNAEHSANKAKYL